MHQCFVGALSTSAHIGLPALYSSLRLYIACSLSCKLSSTLVSCSFTFYSIYVPFPVSFHWFLPWHLSLCLPPPSVFIHLSFVIHFPFHREFRFLSNLIYFCGSMLHSPVSNFISLFSFCLLSCLCFYICVPLLPSCSSIPPSHFCVSPPVGAGCVRRPSSVSLTCRSTPSRTQRPNLTSVLTAPSHSPTPATWPSTSASTAGPSLTPAPTARNLSGSSVIYSSTHGTADPSSPLPTTYHIPPVLLTCPAKFPFWSPDSCHLLPRGEEIGVVWKHILHCHVDVGSHATSSIQKWPLSQNFKTNYTLKKKFGLSP